MVRYDGRGFGLSDWEVADFGLERRVADLETLVESTGLDCFSVLGTVFTSEPSLGWRRRVQLTPSDIRCVHHSPATRQESWT